MKHPIYQAHLNRASDIREHLGLLRGLALDCEVVVELGFRTGVSTSAFLAAEKPVVYSYDTMASNRHVVELAKQYPKTFRFKCMDSREATIPECDMLFIDTDHTYATTLAELQRHHKQVRHWIVLHDTFTFGHTDRKPGKGRGMIPAIGMFLSEHTNWVQRLQIKNSNGLTILGRHQ